MAFGESFASGYSIGKNIRETRERRRVEKENRDLELFKQGYTFNNGKPEIVPGTAADLDKQKIDLAIKSAQQTQGKLDAMVSDGKMVDYAHTGKASYLEEARTSSPTIKKAWEDKGVYGVLDIDWENDKDMLARAGLPESLYDTPEKREIARRNMFKVYDGKEWKVTATNAAVQETGALTRLGMRRGEVFVTNLQDLRGVAKTAFGRSEATQDVIQGDVAEEAAARQGVAPGVTAASNAQKAAEAARKARIDEGELDVKEGQLEINAFKALTERYKASLESKKDNRTNTQKNIDRSKAASVELVELFGGTEKFLQNNFSDFKDYLKAYPLVSEIELLEKSQISEPVKKELRSISQLIALGDPVKKLSPNEAGLIDSNFQKVKKYVSNNLSGVEATSALNAIRSTVRHALFGSALTDAEITSFNEAFGTLGNKIGPVLQQFKTSLMQVKGKLESITRMENPYTSHVRLGVSRDKLDNIIKGIDQRIKYFSGIIDKSGKPAEPAKDKIYKDKPQLGNIITAVGGN